MKYKKSVYNYEVQNNDYYMIYNTLYTTLVRMNCNEYKQYQKEIPVDSEFKKELIENGLWIENSIDERERYLQYVKLHNKYNKGRLDITITPTLACNARCFYCYEEGRRNNNMTYEIADAIVAFIQKNVTESGVHINWFGGEPLMNTKIIDYICTELTELNISYDSYLITNGSLFNAENLDEKIKLWNLGDVQITIDGTEKEYVKRKKYYNLDADVFYKILCNIKLLAEKKVFVHIRINIDEENADDVIELVKYLDSLYADFDNVVYYPAFLTGVSLSLGGEKKVDIIKNIMRQMRCPKKLTANNKLYSLPRTTACMRQVKKSYVVDVYGDIFKCEHHIGIKEKSIANINDVKEQLENMVEKIELNDKCINCVFLPKCMGGCISNKDTNDELCMIEKYIIRAFLEII